MINNTKVSILCGGYYVCTSAWDRDRETDKFNDTFDFFLPLAGAGWIETVEGKCGFRPGHVYFIPGCHVLRWKCESEMPAYWVATVAESFYLRHRLAAIRKVHEWALASVPNVEKVFRRFGEYFVEEKIDGRHQRSDKDSRPRESAPIGLGIKIESTLTYLIGDLIEATEKDFFWTNFSTLERFKPAIDFMDQHYLRCPSLYEVASQSGLVPHYFHRIFKRETGITPFKYMEGRRLDLARKLLSDRRLNVKEVAERTGYNSASQFTRAFTHRYSRSPSQIRLAP